MSNNQIPPQLPPEAPQQVPPQMPQQNIQYQPQYQQQYQPRPQYQPNPYPPKKKIPTGVKVIFVLGALLIFVVLMSAIFSDGNSNDTTGGVTSLNDATKKWKNKAFDDSLHISNGYFSASAMSDFETFIKRYHELELMAVQHAPNEVQDSTIIKSGNRNANDAMAMLTDSITVYRNQYTKVIEKKLWPDKIKVKTQNGGKTLWLIGGLFANNRNIMEFQKASEPMFKALGYKRICYKWADISSAEYTYYDLDK